MGLLVVMSLGCHREIGVMDRLSESVAGRPTGADNVDVLTRCVVLVERRTSPWYTGTAALIVNISLHGRGDTSMESMVIQGRTDHIK